MDANYFRETAALCLRLADGLSLNNPGRFQLMELADDFKDRAKELETQTAQQRIDPRTGTIAKARGYTVERHESGSMVVLPPPFPESFCDGLTPVSSSASGGWQRGSRCCLTE